jgi:predicted CoA-binding protein
MQKGIRAFPVNPNQKEVEGLRCYPNLASLPEQVHGISIITPPAVTEQILEEAARAGIRHVWMQPGAESPEALRRAEEQGMNVIGGGPCILVTMGYHEEVNEVRSEGRVPD